MARTTSKISQVDQYGNVVSVSLLDGYRSYDYDEDSDPKYYGFLDTAGNWYIMRVTSNFSEFVRGTTNIATNWANRVGLTYAPYDQVF